MSTATLVCAPMTAATLPDARALLGAFLEGAWRFYGRQGFRPLGGERLAMLLGVDR